MLMNRLIHHAGFDDGKMDVDVIQMTALLEYCIFIFALYVLLLQQFGTEKHIKLLHFRE